MLSHDPEERPETTDVLSMEFMAADAADDSEAVSHFRRQRRKTASTESEE